MAISRDPRRRKRVGLFGGSFNPVHVGHLLLARAALEVLRLDEVWFIPCADSADGKKLASAAKRLGWLKAALRDEKRFKVLDLELKRGGVSRTIDSVRALRARHEEDRFTLLMGQDQAAKFGSWKEAAALAKLVELRYFRRSGSDIKSPVIPKKFGIAPVDVPQYDISSSNIRRRIKSRLPVAWLLPSMLGKIIRPSDF